MILWNYCRPALDMNSKVYYISNTNPNTESEFPALVEGLRTTQGIRRQGGKPEWRKSRALPVVSTHL